MRTDLFLVVDSLVEQRHEVVDKVAEANGWKLDEVQFSWDFYRAVLEELTAPPKPSKGGAVESSS